MECGLKGKADSNRKQEVMPASRLHTAVHTQLVPSQLQIQALLQKENLFLEYSHITKLTMACEHTPRGGQGRAAGVTYGGHLTSSPCHSEMG